MNETLEEALTAHLGVPSAPAAAGQRALGIDTLAPEPGTAPSAAVRSESEDALIRVSDPCEAVRESSR
jgi:hypothetical protein